MGFSVACFLNGKIKINNAGLVSENSWSDRETHLPGVRAHLEVGMFNQALQLAVGLELIRLYISHEKGLISHLFCRVGAIPEVVAGEYGFIFASFLMPVDLSRGFGGSF